MTCVGLREYGEMGAFASGGQADGGYTTTERDLDEGRNAAILKKKKKK